MAMRTARFLPFFFFYIAVVSHASRNLLDNATATSPVSPQISPLSSVNHTVSTPVSGNKNQNGSPPPSNSSLVTGSLSEPDKEPKKEANPQSQSQSQSQSSNDDQNCDGLPDNKKCKDLNSLVACIQTQTQTNHIESRVLAVLVQNEGEDTLKVNVSGGDFFEELEILKHQSKRVIVPLTEKSMKLILNAGNGQCVIHTSTTPLVSGQNYFLRLPSYDQLVTPVNGAYFLIFTVLILGGSWACCKFRRKQPGGIPYQELEMALPESSSAINVETAEGWDEGWDDDWDEGNAVKSPVGHHLGSISANGLTARSNKDGWENDWDVVK